MTNNDNGNGPDDFEHQDFNPTEEAAPRSGMRANLAEAWRSRPLFKLVVLMTAVAAVVAAAVGFFSSGSSSTNSRLVTPPTISGTPGGPSSPYMQQQTSLANQDRERRALETGGSALPTPMGQVTDAGALSANDRKADPLNDLKAEVERLRQEQKAQPQMQTPTQQVQQVQQAPKPPEQFDDTLAIAMQRQMSQLIEGWTPTGSKEVLVASADTLKALNTAETVTAKEAAAAKASAQANGLSSTPQAKILVTAGTVNYGELLTEANSDVPGPILAQIVSGPFAGARAVGSFQVSNGWADYLVLQFTLVSLKGKDYPISAVALDPNTTLGGMATEVDQRYFTRVVLPAAAGFLQGFGSALGTGGSSVTTNGTTTVVSQSREGYHQGLFQGLGSAASTTSQFFQEQANLIKPLVRVAAGTPIGIFFVTSVTDTTVQQQQALNAQNASSGIYPPGAGLNANPYAASTGANPYAAAGYGASAYGANPYATGATYPGTTVAGYGGAANAASGVPYPNYASQPGANSGYSIIPQNAGTTSYYGH